MKFEGKIRSGGGNTFIITIPKLYVRDGLLEKGKKYIFEVKEVEDEN